MFAWHMVAQPFYSFIFDIFAPVNNEVYCFLIYIVVHGTCMHLLLIGNAIILVKYIFIFHLKNPTAIQDDFWNIFIIIWAFIFAYTAQFIFFMIPKRESNMIYKCLGKIPKQQMYVKHIGNIPLILTVLLSANFLNIMTIKGGSTHLS